MADETPDAPRDDVPGAIPPLRDETGELSPAFVAAIVTAIEAADAATATALAGNLHEVDLADVLMALPPGDRSLFVLLLGARFDFTALTEVDQSVRIEILEALPSNVVADGLRELESDDAVYILEDLDEAQKFEILSQLPLPERTALQRSLDYPEESAGRRMQTDFIAVAPFWTVGQTIDYLRNEKDLPDDFYEIFVIDPRYRLLGTVSLDRMLRTQRHVRIGEVMNEARHLVKATEDQEVVARIFERYNLLSAAVIDEADRLVGVITIDDIVDVIQQEAEEDLRALAGVGDEEISDSVLETVRGRFVWLFFNIFTAFAAAAVISSFEYSIGEMVALAALMPIVASMGGNAGAQSMTVAVRALATGDIDKRNALRTIRREAVVGLVNGVLLAILIGTISGLWFRNLGLGLVMGAALIVNLVVAGLAGILIPLTLNRLRVDPAVASSVFVTTVTDVVGFFAFLGLATWLLIG
ncbi:magnesium transporter [Methylobrevis albus]|uniref:Magnesium transporter MgtE n=1 Tax=Methylobrevis albus TaxID=2793297 RepID=A0A931I269_9HYPH|nr:magnesium transporter [Methylobrevis albus]MBH0238892.1 magnesium transporter [Methylobrevis albus]